MYVANYAIIREVFALAEKWVWGHTTLAFQASSPKTSKARSATTGLFFIFLPRAAQFQRFWVCVGGTAKADSKNAAVSFAIRQCRT